MLTKIHEFLKTPVFVIVNENTHTAPVSLVDVCLYTTHTAGKSPCCMSGGNCVQHAGDGRPALLVSRASARLPATIRSSSPSVRPSVRLIGVSIDSDDCADCQLSLINTNKRRPPSGVAPPGPACRSALYQYFSSNAAPGGARSEVVSRPAGRSADKMTPNGSSRLLVERTSHRLVRCIGHFPRTTSPPTYHTTSSTKLPDCGYNPGWCRSHPTVSRNDLKCVEWDVKPCSVQSNTKLPTRRAAVGIAFRSQYPSVLTEQPVKIPQNPHTPRTDEPRVSFPLMPSTISLRIKIGI